METVTVNFRGLEIEVAVETDTDPNTGPFFTRECILANININMKVANWLDDNFGEDIDDLLNEKFKY